MTLLISAPALAWFIAVVFTTAMDVTTLYATSSFYAYFFSMLLLKQPLSRITVASICLAFAGVLVIVLAGAGGDGAEEGNVVAPNRVLGDIVMTIGMFSARVLPHRRFLEFKGMLILTPNQEPSCLVYTRSCTSSLFPMVKEASNPKTRLHPRTTIIPFPSTLNKQRITNSHHQLHLNLHAKHHRRALHRSLEQMANQKWEDQRVMRFHCLPDRPNEAFNPNILQLLSFGPNRRPLLSWILNIFQTDGQDMTSIIPPLSSFHQRSMRIS